MELSKVVVFREGNEEYGLPIQHVISIEKLEDINVIPNMPYYMKGVVKVRGELIPVLDTNRILYHQDSIIDEQTTKLIVVHSDELSAALIVKEAKEILDIQEEQLKSISVGAFQATKYFTAVASIEDRLITIIDPNLLIAGLEGIAIVKEEIVSHQ
ncbi:purine-binding chemotaxis protein CheW [Metabacillus crassostreae]|uniref:chemotaxis protein CheW n=1 Tax=Metabacillus crassostreae TaxID=929098 RepID=UPI001EF98406|nr:chemotaxis protein CheW [Metabacillus crassostreae]MBM7604537.1 purine-binding chemotaxis protein CheW [Metabacillus crassostreae]